MAEGGEKTEEPTPHRLREAREKGQIAKSREITVAVVLLLSYFLFRYLGEFMWRNLTETAHAIYQLIPEATNFNLALAGYVLLLALRGLALVVLPIFSPPL